MLNCEKKRESRSDRLSLTRLLVDVLVEDGLEIRVGGVKQRRIVFAARHYLARLPQQPPCRFDVVALEAGGIEWLQATFDAT